MTVSSERKKVFILAGCFCVISVLFLNGNLVLNRNDIHVSSKYATVCNAFNNYSTNNATNKARLVLCIFSSNEGFEKRNAIRNSWISTMHQLRKNIQFDLIYKFILSFQTVDTLEESKITEDILFLNKTPKEKGVIGGQMLFTLIRTIHRMYGNISLARIDDDVFVCVPEIFYRIAEVMSPNLYYGFKYGKANSVRQIYPIDEMFVVLGTNLVRRIANRHFCNSHRCLPNELTGLMYGSNPLADWLSIYNDVHVIADNKRIIHFLVKSNYSDQLKPYTQYIRNDFCMNYLIFHKATIEIINQLSEIRYRPLIYQSISSMSSSDDSLNLAPATSGSIFTGRVERPLLKPTLNKNEKQYVIADDNPFCQKWAVVTTIFTPSASVKHLISLLDWCIVIVADEKTPTKSQYFKKLNLNFDHKKVKYLSLTEQRTIYPLLYQTIPVNSFSRKNIGYMYAIHHKADVIWDFDDDNYGIIDLANLTTSRYVTACTTFSSNILNPYPYFGVNDSRTWPRGLPLQTVKVDNTIPEICNTTKPLNIGILQSLANGQPDVDAIYRLTREVPFKFSATVGTHPGLVIPLNTFSPFNGQATLWFKNTFRFIALPVSVNGRVSDIWRSYFAQFFLHKENIHLAFTPPFVFQERNPHTIIKDFNGELDLYQKSRQLIDYLSYLKISSTFSLQKLYNSLYVRHYIDHNDLNFIEAWENTLKEVMKIPN